jgi:hypothetical protein
MQNPIRRSVVRKYKNEEGEFYFSSDSSLEDCEKESYIEYLEIENEVLEHMSSLKDQAIMNICALPDYYLSDIAKRIKNVINSQLLLSSVVSAKKLFSYKRRFRMMPDECIRYLQAKEGEKRAREKQKLKRRKERLKLQRERWKLQNNKTKSPEQRS